MLANALLPLQKIRRRRRSARRSSAFGNALGNAIVSGAQTRQLTPAQTFGLGEDPAITVEELPPDAVGDAQGGAAGGAYSANGSSPSSIGSASTRSLGVSAPVVGAGWSINDQGQPSYADTALDTIQVIGHRPDLTQDSVNQAFWRYDFNNYASTNGFRQIPHGASNAQARAIYYQGNAAFKEGLNKPPVPQILRKDSASSTMST